MRFQEAAQRSRRKQLNEISANIHTGGVQYTSTDEDQAATLARPSMNIGLSPNQPTETEKSHD